MQRRLLERREVMRKYIFVNQALKEDENAPFAWISGEAKKGLGSGLIN